MFGKRFLYLSVTGLAAAGSSFVLGEGPDDLDKLAAQAREVAADAARQGGGEEAGRAAKLGWLSQVSADAEGVFAFYDGKGFWDEIKESQLGQTSLRLLEENDVNLEEEDSPGHMVASLFAEEFIVVVGEGTPDQAANLVTFSEWANMVQIKSGVEMMVKQATGEFGMVDPAGGFFSDPDFLANLVAASEMPPVLVGFRLSDEATREELGATVQALPMMALAFIEDLDYIEVVEFEHGGMTFGGLEVDGEGLVAQMEEEDMVEGLEQMLGAATSADLLKSLEAKDFVVASTVTEEGIFVYLGSDKESIPLVLEGEESLAAGDELAFVDDYLGEKLLSVSWVSEQLFKKSSEGQTGLAGLAEGIKQGLESSDGLGKTDKLIELLSSLAKQEKAWLGMNKYQANGTVSYLKADGLYGESFGGLVDANYDWTTPHKLGSASDSAFLTLQYVEEEETYEVALDYIETLAATVDEAARLASELEIDDFDDFKEGYQIFNESFRADALKLWSGLKMSDRGVGAEGLLEIDLAGTFPSIPNIPDVLVEEAPAPRITSVVPVTDREALGESWKEIDGSVQSLLKTAGELSGNKIPRQKPMSSEKDGLKTWFYPIPMQTDDFVPSITLDESVMAFSTSKNRALEVLTAAKNAPGEEMAGVVLSINFAPLQDYLSTWYTLIDENQEELLTDDDAFEFFLEYQSDIKEYIDGLGELESLKAHTRMEDGELRSSWHLKTK
ncbi:MAG: hypothetical protein Q7Q71_04795 [Verrucomicrobiota bacterium JB023]|nr:hypothetical protein [Verrucomicrobiota bacterium JB023]